MDSLFGGRNIKMSTLTDFSQLSKATRFHLKNVYSCLAICMLVAAVGSYIHVVTGIIQGGIMATLASIGLLILLGITPHTKENQVKRLGFLAGFAFFTGVSLGPLLDRVIEIDPSIISTAFMATTLIFVCFSLSALWAEQRAFLYLGGTLFSGLSLLLLLSLFNIFLGSMLLFKIHLYVGLLIMCGFVLYDTQLIVEKFRRGDSDYIWHCVDLFIDFVNIFRKLLIILAMDKQEKKNKK
ncbi:probable Bax inhibitor 1 [Ptychodera flava]|uniref:probable Bax inhibitor 1 n=1 Tax=Ptychodera flava TaxID=63121 RepID=UPI003969FD6B